MIIKPEWIHEFFEEEAKRLNSRDFQIDHCDHHKDYEYLFVDGTFNVKKLAEFIDNKISENYSILE